MLFQKRKKKKKETNKQRKKKKESTQKNESGDTSGFELYARRRDSNSQPLFSHTHPLPVVITLKCIVSLTDRSHKAVPLCSNTNPQRSHLSGPSSLLRLTVEIFIFSFCYCYFFLYISNSYHFSVCFVLTNMKRH